MIEEERAGELLIRYTESAFRAVLSRDSRPPALREVRWHRVRFRRQQELRFDAVFRNAPVQGWRFRERVDLDGATLDGFCQIECPRIYSRLYEDHLMNQQLEAHRAAILDASRFVSDPRQLTPAIETLREFEEHVRRHHVRELENTLAPPTTGTTATEIHHYTLRIADIQAAINAVQNRNLRERQVSLIVDGIICANDRHSDNREAQARAETLLKSWLSPAQLAQYEKDKSFEVIGGDTGKRYRINYGRQMNIDELDAAGNKVCGWCFLPQGQLVEGDVMLAQKIGLEADETETLKVANRIESHPEVIRFVSLPSGNIVSDNGALWIDAAGIMRSVPVA